MTPPVAVLGLALLWSIAATSSGCKCSEPEEGPGKAKSAIVIFVDTLRADHIGAYGYDKPTSPFVDEMANEGVLFENAYTPTPWTYSSAASLFTGLYPSAHGAHMPGAIRDTNTNPLGVNKLDSSFKTIGHVAQEAGLKSALIAANGYLGLGLENGFARYSNKRGRNARKQVDLALKWIGDLEEEQPFVMVLHFMDVHHPSQSDQADRDPFPSIRKLSPKRYEYFRRWQRRFGQPSPESIPDFRMYKTRRLATYDAAIHSIDRQIRRLIESLGKRRDDTLVIFTADHGEEFWDHAEMEAALYDDPRNTYGISHGHTLFEEQLRVPLIFNLPGVLKPRTVKDRVLLIDVLPTLAEMLGMKDRQPRQGISIASAALEGEPIPPRPFLLDEVCFGHPKQGILVGNDKFIRSLNEPSVLTDMSDGREAENLLKKKPDLAAKLERQLVSMLTESRDLGKRIRGNNKVTIRYFSNEEQDALKALGYIVDDEEDGGTWEKDGGADSGDSGQEDEAAD